MECCRDNRASLAWTEEILQCYARRSEAGELRSLGIVERKRNFDRRIVNRMLGKDIADKVLYGIRRGEGAHFCVQGDGLPG